MRYRLWVRLRRSLARLTKDASVTTIAHETGFSDMAHFSRTFRGMLGITPSEAKQHVAFVDVLSARLGALIG
jgi:transcriptional regulator GlxA family with amidase domain